MMLKVHGIGTCDTCRRARRWLRERGMDHEWIDLREQPPDRAAIERWLDRLGADALVNRRSATWRMLPADRRPALDAPGLVPVLLAHPTLIKRPLFERGREVRAGFDDAARAWLTRH